MSPQECVLRWPSPQDLGDGDDHRFCTTCAFGRVCLSDGYDKRALEDLRAGDLRAQNPCAQRGPAPHAPP